MPLSDKTLHAKDATNPKSLVKFLLAAVSDREDSDAMKTVMNLCDEMKLILKSKMEVNNEEFTDKYIPGLLDLNPDMLFLICNFVCLNCVLNFRLSTLSLHVALMRSPLDLCILKNMNVYSISDVLKSISVLRYYKRNTIGSQYIIPSMIMPPSLLQQSNHFTPSQLRSIGLDRSWTATGIPLNNFFNAEVDLVPLLARLEEEGCLHRFIKKLAIEPLIFKILHMIEYAYSLNLLPNIEEICCDGNVTAGNFKHRIISFEPLCHIYSLKRLVFVCSSVQGNIQSIRNILNMESLDLAGMGITGNAQESLFKLHKLQSLTLQSTKIVGDMSSLEKLTDLQVLELRHNTLFDIDTLDTLSSLLKLKKLCLSQFSTSPVFGNISSLSNLTNLVIIEIRYMKFGGSLHSLSKLVNLRELYLSTCLLEGNIELLSKCIKLEILELSGKSIIGDLKSFSNRLNRIKKLSLVRTSVSGELSSLKTMNRIQELNLSRSVGVRGDIAALSKLDDLQELILEFTGVTGDLKSLCSESRLKRLVLLSCLHTNIEGDVSVVCGLPSLTHLDMKDCKQVRGKLTSLLPQETLKILHLKNTQVERDIPVESFVKLSNVTDEMSIFNI